MPSQSKKKQEFAVALQALIHPETAVGLASVTHNDQFQETQSESKASALDLHLSCSGAVRREGFFKKITCLVEEAVGKL